MNEFNITPKYLILVLMLVGFSAYLNTLPNKMFWDDNDFILNNQYVKDWQYLPQMFKENIISGAGLGSDYWRPMLLMVFGAQWHLWQNWMVGYHAVNLLFHLANGLLLFLLLLSLFPPETNKKKYLAFFTALVFLIHPVQTEAVSYVNSLGDSLSVFFMFLGLKLFLKALTDLRQPYYKNWRYYISVLCYPLAIMSKETAIIMPALVGLVWWFADKTSNGVTARKNFGSQVIKLLEVLGLFIITAGVYIFLRATILNFGGTFNLFGHESNLFTSNIGVRVLTFFRILWAYVGLLAWPQHLHMERSLEWATSFAHVDVIFGTLIFSIIFSLALWQFNKKNAISFGLLWFLLALAPTSNIAVPINGLLYEHWLYVPMIGFFLAVFSGLGYLWTKFKNLKWLIGTLVFVMFSGFFVRTILRNFEWREPIIFYTQTLEYSPKSYRIINNLAMEYAGRNINDKAEEYYLRAIKTDPAVVVAYFNLGNLYIAENKIEQAQKQYETTLLKDPKFFYAYPSLIQLYLSQGKNNEAQALYSQYKKYVGDN